MSRYREIVGAIAYGAVFVLAMVGCGGPDDPETPQPPVTIARTIESAVTVDGFYRIGDAGVDKARIGNEYRDVLYRPYVLEMNKVEVQDGGVVDLPAVVDMAQTSPSAEGMDITFVVGAARHHEFTAFTSTDAASRVAPAITLSREFLANVTEQTPLHVHVRELTPLTDYASPWLNIPPDARLDFGIALEAAMTAAPGSVRFTVELETADNEIGLFEQVLVEPLDTDLAYGWTDVSIDLDQFKGLQARFVFSADRIPGAQGAGVRNTASALWSVPIVQVTQAAASLERPNIILISLDTLRADHLGAYGYERDTSPNLDRFFEEGVVFEQCISTSSWTTPSHASIFTGLSPTVHRANGLNGYRLRDEFTTLAELARASGQLTAAFTEGVAVGGQLGFYQGFDRYSNGPSVAPVPPGTAEKTFGLASDWLDRFGHQPFMLFVHTYEIHAKYDAPEPFKRMFVAPEFMDEPPYVPGIMELLGDQIPDDRKSLVVSMYDGGIRYTDDVVGKFFAKLEADGLLDNTLVVVFSDHGEEFWEHGGTVHGMALFKESLHVPLFVRFPGDSGPKGRVSDLVSVSDIFATVAEFVSFDVPSSPDTFSLLPLADPERYAGTFDREVVVSQVLQLQLKWLMMSAQTDRHKYVLWTDYSKELSPLNDFVGSYQDEFTALLERELLQRVLPLGPGHAPKFDEPAIGDSLKRIFTEPYIEFLFDLSNDKMEQSNLADESPEFLQRARNEFLDTLKLFSESPPVSAVAGSAVAPLSDREREELRALGYLD